MPAPNGIRDSGTDATPLEGITLTREQAWVAAEALFRDLERLLTDTAERVAVIYERRGDFDDEGKRSLCADTRPAFD